MSLFVKVAGDGKKSRHNSPIKDKSHSFSGWWKIIMFNSNSVVALAGNQVRRLTTTRRMMTMAREKCEMWKREVYSFSCKQFSFVQTVIRFLHCSLVLCLMLHLYGVCSISSRFSEEGRRERSEWEKQNKTKQKSNGNGLDRVGRRTTTSAKRISTMLNSKVPSPENLTETWEGSDCSEKKLWKWSLTFNRLAAIKIICRWAKRE